MCAAISDFSIDKLRINGKTIKSFPIKKIPSDSKVEIKLKKNFKIINKLKSYAKTDPLIIGFKLTDTDNKRKIEKAVANVRGDVVVHNDIPTDKKRTFTIYEGSKKTLCASRKDLAKKLFSIIKRRTKK
jgi:phosphopantothenoylcysteine synthetase/decarboxylase